MSPIPLLAGPVLPTLLRLALPNVLAMVITVCVGVAETYYIGVLGTAPLAAMALVFPFVMLTQMMSAGAMGGGVSSAISRALGAKDLNRANALVLHALLIGGLAGVLHSAIFLSFARPIFEVLGAKGEVLQLALDYARLLFSGAVLVWLLNTLASVLRGTGNMNTPSLVIFGSALVQIALGGSLGLGLGPIPRLGMAGVAWGQIVATAAGVGVLLWFLLSGRCQVRPSLNGGSLDKGLFTSILKVGALACLSPVQSVLAMVIFTGLVARLGVVELAGYGIGQRLEFLLIPIAFGIGVASVPMVGMAMGAGDVARARRVAWTAAAVSAGSLGAIGLLVALAPGVWVGLFTRDPAVASVAASFLHIVGPAFAFFGLGLTLYFASQGSGKVAGPVLASTIRLVLIAAVGTWLASHSGRALDYFALAAAGMVLYGLSTTVAIRMTRWTTGS